ncbi:hypothetical protein SAMN02745751_03654 [Dethiosulfatibacter aminovorans DSM 17477]|uniref:SCP-2 sterol transfer family protein n=1 Tax=Dethiosulfatibacter aminovorans DSM 17477 TaxID=1121476 RepID=A0A1M6N104_9FIRM|nr:hypothetical protein [Dethiosulfatibacter aminovorans]SHJ89312.1 hypothetical protein SAMN02745751_03654 [Dethiosulfatibacter aminovorans DSM 17477]
MSLYDKMLNLKQLINGEEAEKFLNYYYGKFFKGDITIIDGEETCTLTFRYGQCIDVIEGIPETGIDIGVSGSDKEWKKFMGHRSLSVATNRGNSDNLTTIGGAVRFRQNFNVVAQLARVYAGIR